MEQVRSKQEIISKLKKEILSLQGFNPVCAGITQFSGLGPIEAAFPNGVFPRAAIHEFISAEPEHAAACGGFIGGLLKELMINKGACLWISRSRMIFPAALKTFGIEPENIVFIDVVREKDVLWVMEEALKCMGLAAVIGEVREISFMESRRLQLAVERSKVTGFVLRTDATKISTTACVARWQITPIATELDDGMPGLGAPRWKVNLLRVRNGNPGSWNMAWATGAFQFIPERTTLPELNERLKIG
ncbi:ImuA family protein [Pedobacter immunditicola]|uniref:ImuA family protein n=1 Tax=Pedobacter immunditicola TaxID=3133440 RepID=UPI0030ADD403